MLWLETLHAAVEERAADVYPPNLAQSAARLSEFYRSGTMPRRIVEADPLFPLAYAVTRMPATAAALRFVFEKIRERMSVTPPQSLLDLGSGPGASIFALPNSLPEIQRLTLIERHTRLMELGRSLSGPLASATGLAVDWKNEPIPLAQSPAPHDVVLISYVLNELSAAERTRVVEQAWNAAEQALVIIEPGTPAGFASLMASRSELIARGARILIPCPGEMTCPLDGVPNQWCHFSVRLARSRRHRMAKGGQIGWEDEKFCYAVFRREPIESRRSCIIGRPSAIKPGITLSLCTPAGLRTETVARKDRPAHARARKLAWGDFWD